MAEVKGGHCWQQMLEDGDSRHVIVYVDFGSAAGGGVPLSKALVT